jgi:hypothetical protein
MIQLFAQILQTNQNLLDIRRESMKAESNQRIHY